MMPQIRYAKSGDVNIAYQVFGQAPLDLVLIPGWVSNMGRTRRRPVPHAASVILTRRSLRQARDWALGPCGRDAEPRDAHG